VLFFSTPFFIPMKNQPVYDALKGQVPLHSLTYCYELWERHPFKLKITKSRKSKLGDYRFDSILKIHQISVNGDLNPYAFLITYIHEVAHLLVKVNNRRILPPHGIVWKNTFKEVFEPLLNEYVFPEKVLFPLLKYMNNPKASSYADQNLMMALRNYDLNKINQPVLGDLEIGDVFKINNRVFKKEETKRTRVLCQEVKSRRKYLIPKIAEVERL